MKGASGAWVLRTLPKRTGAPSTLPANQKFYNTRTYSLQEPLLIVHRPARGNKYRRTGRLAHLLIGAIKQNDQRWHRAAFRQDLSKSNERKHKRRAGEAFFLYNSHRIPLVHPDDTQTTFLQHSFLYDSVRAEKTIRSPNVKISTPSGFMIPFPNNNKAFFKRSSTLPAISPRTRH